MIEAELRREGFSEGQGVNLADGNRWYFPKPLIERRPRFVDGRPSYRDSSLRLTFGPDHDEALAAVWASDGFDRLEQTGWLAADLLRKNYMLSDDELSELLRVVTDEDDGGKPTPTSLMMWRAIADAVVLPEPDTTKPVPPTCAACGQPKPGEAIP